MVSKKLLFGLIVPVLLGISLRRYLNQPRVNLPKHLLNHHVETIPDFLSPEVGDELMDLIKKMAVFPTNTNDLQFYKTLHEHIGEAIPIGANGTCDHPFLIPSMDRKSCVLPSRIDVGRHYITTGGFEGLKENLDDLTSRILSFGRYMFNLTEFPTVEKLFASDSFQEAAKRVCPVDKQYLDPFQFNFIIQVPGQTVALHVDGVYFWGATRFQIPQWLLAVMKFSGLFESEFIDQIQVVAYLHRWTSEDSKDGSFVFWRQNGKEEYVPATPLLGSIVDGSKTVHAALVYRPKVKAPKLDKSSKNELVYLGDDKWQLVSNGKVVNSYATNDLRISIVYRARCFENEARAKHFNSLPDDEILSLDNILEVLKNDLVRRGKLGAEQDISRMDLAMKLMDTYISYPLPPHATIPFNYCALSKLYPIIKPVLDLVC